MIDRFKPVIDFLWLYFKEKEKKLYHNSLKHAVTLTITKKFLNVIIIEIQILLLLLSKLPHMSGFQKVVLALSSCLFGKKSEILFSRRKIDNQASCLRISIRNLHFRNLKKCISRLYRVM